MPGHFDAFQQAIFNECTGLTRNIRFNFLNDTGRRRIAQYIKECSQLPEIRTYSITKIKNTLVNINPIIQYLNNPIDINKLSTLIYLDNRTEQPIRRDYENLAPILLANNPNNLREAIINSIIDNNRIDNNRNTNRTRTETNPDELHCPTEEPILNGLPIAPPVELTRENIHQVDCECEECLNRDRSIEITRANEIIEIERQNAEQRRINSEQRRFPIEREPTITEERNHDPIRRAIEHMSNELQQPRI